MATASEVRDMLRRLGEGGGLRDIVKTALVETALRGESVAKRNVATVLNVRSGHLRRSITGFVRDTPDGPEAVIRAGGRLPDSPVDVRYARTHEYGATIVPTRGQYLRIPLPPALTGAGVDRFGGPLRVMAPDTFTVLRARNGGLFLKHKRTGALWYKLVRSVTIRPRPFLRPAAEDAAERFPRYFAAALTRATT